MKQPYKKEIKEYLELSQRLEAFEAGQRMIRGYGVFSDDELPVPVYQKVTKWLESLTK